MVWLISYTCHCHTIHEEPGHQQEWYWPTVKYPIQDAPNPQNLNVSRLVLQLSLPNLLKPGYNWKMKMSLEQRRQVMLQLHLSDQQFYCLLKCSLYERFNGTYILHGIFRSLQESWRWTSILCAYHIRFVSQCIWNDTFLDTFQQ